MFVLRDGGSVSRGLGCEGVLIVGVKIHCQSTLGQGINPQLVIKYPQWRMYSASP